MIVMFVMFAVFAVLAVGLAVASAVASRADQQWFQRNGERVKGQIVSVRVHRQVSTSTDGLGGVTTQVHRRYVPSVRFTTVDGRLIETETRANARRPGAEGEMVEVLYDPADPSRARIASS